VAAALFSREQAMTFFHAQLLRIAAVAAVLMGTWTPLGRDCQAIDDTQPFVEALRQQHYFDTAAAYLQRRANDPNVAADAKSTIAYQQALVLLEAAEQASDVKVRDDDRRQAQDKLKEFLAANPEHELAPAARERLGNLLLEMGDTILAQAKKWGGNQSKQRSQAQTKYGDARGVFEESARRLRAQLDKLPAGEQREELGPQWLGASVNVGRATYEMALASEPDSDQQKKLFSDAAAQCSSLYHKYPKRLGGAVAHFYEACCYDELGQRPEALTAYTDLIVDLPEAEASFRPIKTQALKRAQQLWMQNHDYQAVVDATLTLAKTAHGAELQDADWLAIKLATATSLKEVVAASTKKDVKTTSYLRDAKELASDVAKSKNAELQTQARDLLAQIERGIDQAPAAKDAPQRSATPKRQVLQLAAETRTTTPAATADHQTPEEAPSFDEMYDRAADATEDVKSIQIELDFARKEETPDTKHIAELETDLKTRRDESMKFCLEAMARAGVGANVEKLNQLRYWVCWFQYAKGNYYDAALLGDFLARKYPKASGALPGAQVAMASLDAIYRQHRQAGDNNATFAGTQLNSLAAYVMKQWPNEPEAAAALEALIRFAIDEGNYDKVRKIIGQMPDSVARISGEAKLGQALWAKYLRTMQQQREQKAAETTDATANNNGAAAAAPAATAPAANAPTKQDLDAMLKEAEQSLELGIDGFRKQENVDERAVLAALSLAQLEVNGGHANKAVALLDDPKIGPMTLLKKNSPATQAENIPAEIYKTALRAYVAAEPQQLDDATAAMDALEKLYASDPDGPARLTQLLVSSAYDLQQQIDELNREGNSDKAASTVKAFEKFLSKIAQRESAVDYRTLNWVAAMYEGLGNGLSPGELGNGAAGSTGSHRAVKLTADEKRYLEQAVKAYEAILARAKEKPDSVPADRLPVIKRRLALDYRSLGDYQKSIDLFIELLKDKPTLLPVQIEAAYTYQMRGENDNPDYFVGAMLGGRGPAQSIWGWSQIAQRAARDKKFVDVFHEARYNMALCRVEFSATRKDPEEKKKLLELAKKTIRETKQFEGTMGGAKWKPQYDKLLREIQKGLGDSVSGLTAFDQEEAEKNAAKAKDDQKN
jgi:hypothetical protein